MGRGWFDVPAVRAAVDAYFDGGSDNSFFMWQWISVGMCSETRSGVVAA
jgi:hypothetical protein